MSYGYLRAASCADTSLPSSGPRECMLLGVCISVFCGLKSANDPPQTQRCTSLSEGGAEIKTRATLFLTALHRFDWFAHFFSFIIGDNHSSEYESTVVLIFHEVSHHSLWVVPPYTH